MPRAHAALSDSAPSSWRSCGLKLAAPFTVISCNGPKSDLRFLSNGSCPPVLWVKGYCECRIHVRSHCWTCLELPESAFALLKMDARGGRLCRGLGCPKCGSLESWGRASWCPQCGFYPRLETSVGDAPRLRETLAYGNICRSLVAAGSLAAYACLDLGHFVWESWRFSAAAWPVVC